MSSDIHHSAELLLEVRGWLRDIHHKLDRVLSNQERQMSATDDLNNAVTALADGFNALDAAVQTELQALVAALGSSNTAAVTQAVANIGTITNRMAQDAAALTASIPAATTVQAPAPVPTPVAPTADVPVIEVPTVTAPDATAPTA